MLIFTGASIFITLANSVLTNWYYQKESRATFLYVTIMLLRENISNKSTLKMMDTAGKENSLDVGIFIKTRGI